MTHAKNIAARALTAVLTVATAAGAGTALAVPASAHWSQCPAGSICLWEHTGYQGRMQAFQGASVNIGGYMNDRTTSVWNRSSQAVSFYRDSHHGGLCLFSLSAGGSKANLPRGANDNVTSLRAGVDPHCGPQIG